MGTTFNSFDSSEKHEFVHAMESFLTLTKALTLAPKKLLFLYRSTERKYKEACEVMNKHIAEIIAKRKAKLTKSPGSMPDLLDLMLEGTDAVTGKSMTAANIAFQAMRLGLHRPLPSELLRVLACCRSLRFWLRATTPPPRP
jgi:hypothetical protein